ncbi:MAG: DegT/DnrJ/EryC1/StrS family aminotransferase, partial [Nitrososphaerales archaeon]
VWRKIYCAPSRVPNNRRHTRELEKLLILIPDGTGYLLPKQFRVPMSRPDIGSEERNAILSVLDDGWVSQGKVSQKFEALLSKYLPGYATRHSYMLFFAMAKDKASKEAYIKQATKQGIDDRKCWTPIHMQPCNPELHESKCPNAERIFERTITLPIYNSMKPDEVATVVEAFS